MYDLNVLRPDEKDQLLNELLRRYENDTHQPGVFGNASVPPQAGDATSQATDDDDGSLIQVIQMLVQKVQSLEDRVEQNEKVLMDDLIGGINSTYQSGLRNMGISGLKSKYGSLFDPHMDAINEMEPDSDLYGTLYDMLEQAKGNDGFDEEGTVGSVADLIKQKIDRIKGIVPEAVTSTADTTEPTTDAAPVSIEKTTVSTDPTEGGADQAFLDKVKAMTVKNKASGAKGLF